MKIICIGRNYLDHAKELNNEAPSEPVIFLKPETSIIAKRQAFFIPDFSDDVHHELEVVVKINRVGKHIEERFAHKYYDEITVGLDFTARDLQQKLKSKGLPWEKAKAFDGSAMVGRFIPANSLNNLPIDFHLTKNSETVQRGNSSDMLFSINKIISEVSKYFTIKIGDLIFTGTPAGVGPVSKGDILEGYIGEENLFRLNVK